jgi:RND family efflux transporter MFP subunit
VLRSETDGKIAKLALSPGKRFAEGDLLVQLASREAALAVSLAKARLAEAVRSRDRFAKLQRRGNVAAARLDEARTAAEVARLELGQARQRLTTRAIRAPFDGVAGLTEVEVGAWVDTGVAIARYDDRSAIVVEFDLPEALIERVNLGMPLTVTTPSAVGRRFTGSVVAIDNRVDATSRSIRVRAEAPNPEDQLRPGASFIVRLDFPGKTYARTPELAVQYSNNALHVWRISGNKAEKTPVRMIRRLEGAVLVDGDLKEGDLVVI